MNIFHIINDITSNEYQSIKCEPQLLIEIIGDLNSAVIEEINHTNRRLNLKELRMRIINKPRHFKTCIYCDTDSYIIRYKKGEIKLIYQKRYQGDYDLKINDSNDIHLNTFTKYAYHSRMFIINSNKTLYHRGMNCPHTLTLTLQITQLNISISESEETYCDNGDLLILLMKGWKEYINNFIISEKLTTSLTIKFYYDLITNLK